LNDCIISFEGLTIYFFDYAVIFLCKISNSDVPLPSLCIDNVSDNHYLEKALHVPELVIVWNHTIINFISDKFKRIVSVREIHSGHHEVITEIDKGKTKVSKLVATHVFQRHLS